MAFSSGAYFGSHSTVSQGRAARAFRLALLVWIGALARTRETGRTSRPAAGPEPRARTDVQSEPRQQGSEVAGPLGGAGEDDQLAAGVVEHAEERALLRLPWRLDPEVGAAPGPAVGEIGVWVSASDSSPNSRWMSPARACCLRSLRRRPA